MATFLLSEPSAVLFGPLPRPSINADWMLCKVQIKQEQREQQHDAVAGTMKRYKQRENKKKDNAQIHLRVRNSDAARPLTAMLHAHILACTVTVVLLTQTSHQFDLCLADLLPHAAEPWFPARY